MPPPGCMEEEGEKKPRMEHYEVLCSGYGMPIALTNTHSGYATRKEKRHGCWRGAVGKKGIRSRRAWESDGAGGP